ncbi:MAG: acetyl-CoA carboxylase biotin carboxyl carrier protein [Clostridia bacterium]|nr:acetyl-CoA carboxylase biotin carboxyl carrier protein [Clostridia bacterium]
MNYEDIKKLMDDMGESKIDALEIEFPEGMKISMKKSGNSSNKNVESVPVSTHQEIQNIVVQENKTNSSQQEDLQENLKIVTSPMVGTFYEASSPKQPALVKVGDKVKKGDVLCIIEAMKLMNEIESEYDGEIVEICVQNEEMVDFGKPLFKIK